MPWKWIPPGRVNWYIGWIGADGKEKRRSTKTDNEKAAERILAKVKVEIAEGRFLDKKIVSTMTLKTFGEAYYLPRMDRLKPRSKKWRRDRWNRILEVLGGSMSLEEANRLETVETYVGRRLGTAYAGGKRLGTVTLATVKQDVAVFRHAIRQAVRWKGETNLLEYHLHDWIPPDDPRPPAKPQPVDPDAWGKLLEAARARASRKNATWGDRHGYAVLLLARTLGARRGEILRLTRDDVDFDRGIVRRLILKKRTLGERKETAIEGEPLELLREIAASHDQDLIFGNPKTGATRKDIKSFWNGIRDAAGVRSNFHAIRHAYGRDFLAGGGDLRTLQDRLGHSNYATTEKYAHLAKRAAPPKGLPVEMVDGMADSAAAAQGASRPVSAIAKSRNSRENAKGRRRVG